MEGIRIVVVSLIVNEVVDEVRCTGTRGVVFMLNFEKVNDRVSWIF